MSEPKDDPHLALRRALHIAHAGPEEALEILEAGLALAGANSDSAALVSLACHAGVVSAELGYLERSRDYYRRAALVAPDDAMVHLALGGVLRDLEEIDAAEAEFSTSPGLAHQVNDDDLLRAANAAREALRSRKS